MSLKMDKEYCDNCNQELEVGQIGKCEDCATSAYVQSTAEALREKLAAFAVAADGDSNDTEHEAASAIIDAASDLLDALTQKGIVAQPDVTLPRVTYAEAATILAALRYLQDRFGCDPSFARNFSQWSHFEDVDPLTIAQINDLCERINLQPDIEQPKPKKKKGARRG